MAPDVREDQESQIASDQQDEQKGELFFEPGEFYEEHGELKFENFKLSDDQLREKAIAVTNLRKQILVKAESLK